MSDAHSAGAAWRREARNLLVCLEAAAAARPVMREQFRKVRIAEEEGQDVERLLARPRPPDDDPSWRSAAEVVDRLAHDLPPQRRQPWIGAAVRLVADDRVHHPIAHVARGIAVAVLQRDGPGEGWLGRKKRDGFAIAEAGGGAEQVRARQGRVELVVGG